MSVYQMSQHKKRKSGKQIVSKLHNTEMLFREQEGRKFLHSEMDQKKHRYQNICLFTEPKSCCQGKKKITIEQCREKPQMPFHLRAVII